MKAAILLAGLLALAGCAGLQAAAPTVCVPPGFPPFSLWQSGAPDVAVTNDEAGRPHLVIRRHDHVRGAPVISFWTGGLLAAVDPAPFDPDVPAWIDRGAVAGPEFRLRAIPRSTCQWERQPVPARPDHKA